MTEETRRALEILGAQIALHQARLQVIAANWAELTVMTLDATEKRYLAALRSGLDDFVFVANTAGSIEKVRKLAAKLAAIRDVAFASALAEIEVQARELAEAETAWAAKLTRSLFEIPAGGEKPTPPKLADVTSAKLDKVVKNGLAQGETIRQWYQQLAAEEAARVEAAIADSLAAGKSIPEIARDIQGSADADFKDGVLNVTRNSATRMARTITNALANNAKDEFYKANSDVLAGVEILATLDGRTCPVCAGVDRTRYKLGEPHPALPLHFNCRCVLLPVTPLSDAVPATRPMARADFMAEAERMYKERYPRKDFAALAPSTKEKYYYEAMKEYERRTGKSAYTEVPGSVSFRKYFTDYMSEGQRRDWLGPERYAIWKRGNLPLDDFIPPYPNPRLTVKALRELDAADFPAGS